MTEKRGIKEKMKLGLQISATIFAAIAILHLIRLVTMAEAIVLGWDVPLWFSLLALILAGSLSAWLLNLASQK